MTVSASLHPTRCSGSRWRRSTGLWTRSSGRDAWRPDRQTSFDCIRRGSCGGGRKGPAMAAV